MRKKFYSFLLGTSQNVEEISDLKSGNGITYVKYNKLDTENKALFDNNGNKLEVNIEDENFFDYCMLFFESLDLSGDNYKTFFYSKGYTCEWDNNNNIVCTKNENVIYKFCWGKYYYMDGEEENKNNCNNHPTLNLIDTKSLNEINFGNNVKFNNSSYKVIYYVKK